MPRVLLTVLILAIAMALYLAGASGPSVALLVLGGTFEAWFWVRAWRGLGSRAG
jgi:hypothetical protein